MSDELREILIANFGRQWRHNWSLKLFSDDDIDRVIGQLSKFSVTHSVPNPYSNARDREFAISQPPGEVWVYLFPTFGQEWRWLTTALFADRVLLACPEPQMWLNVVKGTTA